MVNEKDLEFGQKVKFVRIKSAPGVPDELVNGEGMVMAKIVMPNGRLNIAVKDSSSGTPYHVEPYCIEPTDADGIEYFAHRQKLNDIADKYNKAAEEAHALQIKIGNDEIDQLNNSMFGPPVVVVEGNTVH